MAQELPRNEGRPQTGDASASAGATIERPRYGNVNSVIRNLPGRGTDWSGPVRPTRPRVERLEAHQRSRVRSGRSWWMESDATLARNGYLRLDTRTWSSQFLSGFHGGVMVFLIDETGLAHYGSQKLRYGVNANGSRKDVHTESVPREVVENTVQLGIVHWHWPKTQIPGWVMDLAELVKIGVDVAKLLATAQQNGGSATTGPPGSLR